MQIDQGFAPLLNSNLAPKVLILGTMPSVRSLAQHRYYAHPQNSFWWIMSELFHFDFQLSYEKRGEHMVAHRVMIWDVVHSCHRPGSLDASIQDDTVKVNDFEALFSAFPDLSLIAFNGQSARKLFKKHVEPVQQLKRQLDMKVMPSTSPAYAAMRKEQKLECWREILEYL